MTKKIINVTTIFIFSVISLQASSINTFENAFKMYKEGDYINSIKIFKILDKENDNKAQRILGNIYSNGKGVKINYIKSFNYYLKSAKNGNKISPFYVGYMYQTGYGTNIDIDKSFKWYTVASKNDNEEGEDSLINIANFKENKNSKFYNPKDAFNINLKLAKKGNMYSQFIIAEDYFYGKSIKKDFSKALKWYKKSAKQLNGKAEFKLGLFYSTGDCSLNKNFKLALKYFKKSGRSGIKEGEINYLQLKNSINKSEI